MNIYELCKIGINGSIDISGMTSATGAIYNKNATAEPLNIHTMPGDWFLKTKKEAMTAKINEDEAWVLTDETTGNIAIEIL